MNGCPVLVSYSLIDFHYRALLSLETQSPLIAIFYNHPHTVQLPTITIFPLLIHTLRQDCLIPLLIALPLLILKLDTLVNTLRNSLKTTNHISTPHLNVIRALSFTQDTTTLRDMLYRKNKHQQEDSFCIFFLCFEKQPQTSLFIQPTLFILWSSLLSLLSYPTCRCPGKKNGNIRNNFTALKGGGV